MSQRKLQEYADYLQNRKFHPDVDFVKDNLEKRLPEKAETTLKQIKELTENPKILENPFKTEKMTIFEEDNSRLKFYA